MERTNVVLVRSRETITKTQAKKEKTQEDFE